MIKRTLKKANAIKTAASFAGVLNKILWFAPNTQDPIVIIISSNHTDVSLDLINSFIVLRQQVQ